MTYVSALLAKDASRILPFDGYELKTKAKENAFVRSGWANLNRVVSGKIC